MKMLRIHHRTVCLRTHRLSLYGSTIYVPLATLCVSNALATPAT